MTENEVMDEVNENSVIDDFTPEELAELQHYATGMSPVPDEKHNVHKFLWEVAQSDDTTKTGFLTDEEVGVPRLPNRTLKELELFSRDVANMDYFAEYFKKRSEILTSTSLAKNAKLIELAVITKREIETGNKPRKENRSWFKKRDKGGSE